MVELQFNQPKAIETAHHGPTEQSILHPTAVLTALENFSLFSLHYEANPSIGSTIKP
jgi:hypothetical protein